MHLNWIKMNLICVASISSNGFPGNRTVGYQISPPWFHEKFLSGIAKIAKVKVKIRNSAVFFGGNSTLRISVIRQRFQNFSSEV